MIVLSHRGYWKLEKEKNTKVAFSRSFNLGFGTETDIRDWKEQLVIAHDLATPKDLLFENFLELYCNHAPSLPLAINIKSDGLQVHLKRLLDKFNVNNYFVFDMSVPDGLAYLKNGIRVFTRQSEYEVTPSFYKEAHGIWLDEFHGHWINEKIINFHLQENKQVCIVSPELHGRTFEIEWEHYREIQKKVEPNQLMLCTDHPELAQQFFNYDSN
ncbi:hypothetical protein [Haliscomenobacter sp.]|uniref:hypothetical protein n=1 Tax=Haliscomenobacter sp. TaxID=2717303 RepID=UPI003BAB2BBB